METNAMYMNFDKFAQTYTAVERSSKWTWWKSIGYFTIFI